MGVGLGFGLQQIASNFISGFIILLDRSVTIGDYIQLEDGRAGTLRELNMRYSILETFDGKEIIEPTLVLAQVHRQTPDLIDREPGETVGRQDFGLERNDRLILDCQFNFRTSAPSTRSSSTG